MARVNGTGISHPVPVNMPTRKIDGFSIASLICGIMPWAAGLALLASSNSRLGIELSAHQYLMGYLSSLAVAVMAIVLAIIGRRELARGQATAGRGYATAGMVLGIVYFAATILAIIGFISLYSLYLASF